VSFFNFVCPKQVKEKETRQKIKKLTGFNLFPEKL